MNQGFVDSTLERSRSNLQVERQRFRRSSGSDNGSTEIGQLSTTRLLPAAPNQESVTLNLGVRGDGALVGRDLYQVRGKPNNNHSFNRYPEGDFLARQIGRGAVDLCLGQSYNAPISSFNSIRTARGPFSVLLGGSNNNIIGQYANNAAIIGGSDCNAGQSYASIVGSFYSSAYGQYSVILGGVSGYTSASFAAVLGGQSCSVFGSYSASIGGSSNSTSSWYSVTLGGRGLLTKTEGEVAFGANSPSLGKAFGSLIALQGSSGPNSNNGNCNLGVDYSAYYDGSENASTVLSVDLNEMIAFEGTIVGSTSGSATKAYFVKLVGRRGSGNDFVILGTPVIDLLHSASADSWTLSIGTYASSVNGVKFTVNTGSTAVTWSLVGTVNRLTYQ